MSLVSRPIFFPTDKSAESLWIASHGKVYDFTDFFKDHPGGDDLVLKYAGSDMGHIMADPDQHVHSRSAYDMMEDFQIGYLGGVDKIVSEDWVPDPNFHPEDTDTVADFRKSRFLDLDQPLLGQVWRANFSKDYYLEQIHQPRHTRKPVRLFHYSFLEPLLMTKWYIVPMVWGPVTLMLALLAIVQFDDMTMGYRNVLQMLAHPSWLAPAASRGASINSVMSQHITARGLESFGIYFVLGCLMWTLLEYTFHRFLFHLDDYLPDNGFALTTHFVFHGIHHYVPMDKNRVATPPLLFTGAALLLSSLVHSLACKPVANALIAGAVTFCKSFFFVLFAWGMALSD